MGLFDKLFGAKKLTLNDSDFGEIESFYIKKDKVGWMITQKYLGFKIDIYFTGDKNGLKENQKKIVKSALNNDSQILLESEIALKEQFENAEKPFISLRKHFILRSMSFNDLNLVLSFEELETAYHFNVYFNNNKQVGVSIDS